VFSIKYIQSFGCPVTEGNDTKGNAMIDSSIDSLKIKAKLLQKAKRKKNVEFTLKEAYGLIASSGGYSSWKDMKDAYVLADLLNPPRWSAQWKTWFSSKEEALIHMNQEMNFLLPYRKHFFICDINYLKSLGVSQNDPDLLKVGNDWSEPENKEAWQRLLETIKSNHQSS